MGTECDQAPDLGIAIDRDRIVTGATPRLGKTCTLRADEEGSLKLKEWYPSEDHSELAKALGLTIANALEAGVIQESEKAPKGGG